MRKKLLAPIAILCAVALVGGVVFNQWLTEEAIANDERQQPEDSEKVWAEPIEMAGAANLHKVSDALYRGEQPTAEGFRNLKEKLGIRTVVNLRLLHSDRDEIGDLDLEYHHIRMEPWDIDDDEVLRFLRIVNDPEKHPVFVHCQHGADRTGTACAIYRIVVEKWPKEEALSEMRKGGFNYHEIWINIPPYIQGLDVDALRSAMEAETLEKGLEILKASKKKTADDDKADD